MARYIDSDPDPMRCAKNVRKLTFDQEGRNSSFIVTDVEICRHDIMKRHMQYEPLVNGV